MLISLRGKGFTLIEIIIVVVIISIAAMVVIPLAGSAAGIQLKSAADMIAGDLEYAKSQSITQGQGFSVVFDKSEESYRIKDPNSSVIEHPVNNGDYIIDLGQKGLDKVDIQDVDFDLSDTIYFDYLGSPYSGTDPLNTGVITLQAEGTTVKVYVEPVTGFISVVE